MGSVWAPLGSILVCFCGSVAGPWAPFSGFLETPRKRVKKGRKKGAEMDVFSMIFYVFRENAKVRFDCAGANGLRFRPLIFWLCAFILALLFLHCFFDVFGLPRGPKNHGFHEVGGRGGTPLNPAAGSQKEPFRL